MGDVRAVLIAGPTASGKSALALRLAAALGGAIVNADSMQVFEGLRILTARPSHEDLRLAPHHLYGHVPPTDGYSVGAWTREVAPLLGRLAGEGRVPVVCGGTGLYFKALLGGLDEMPAVPVDVRARWRALMEREGPAALHRELARRDPAAAARIRPADPQRILRALELGEATGRPLAELQKGGGEALLDPAAALKIVLVPPRETVRRRIADRFAAMIEAGAVDEVRRFAARPGALEGGAGKAIGVAELLDHMAGHIDLRQAAISAVTRSRQYAKRQDTWFRHQFGGDWVRLADPMAAGPDALIGAWEASRRASGTGSDKGAAREAARNLTGAD